MNNNDATRQCLGCGAQEEFRNCADISIGYPEPPSTTVAPSSGKPNATGQNKRQNQGRVRSNLPEYRKGSYVAAKRVSNGIKSLAGNDTPRQKDRLSKKRYQKVYKSEMDKVAKLMKSGGNKFNFRVRRIEETLSLLDDTERVLETLETHLDKNASSSEMSGSEFVKLYAGLVWIKRKIRHLESLTTKVSSKLSLIRHTINMMTRSGLDKGMRLSEHALKSDVTRWRVGSKRSGNNSQKYEKTVVAVRNEAIERPVYRMAARKYRTEAISRGQSGKTKVKERPIYRIEVRKDRTDTKSRSQGEMKVRSANKKGSKIKNVAGRSDHVKSTKLASKFPALNSWKQNTLNPTKAQARKLANHVASSSKRTSPVFAPDVMPWSPNTIALAHDNVKLKVEVRPESFTANGMRRTIQRGKPVVVSTKQPNIAKTNEMTLKNNVSNARKLLRRTQHGKPVLSSTKQHNIAKTKEMIKKTSNARKLRRRTQHGKPVVASTKQPHIAKTNKMTLKNNVSNARKLLRRTQHGKPVVASTKQPHISKTNKMTLKNNVSNARKLLRRTQHGKPVVASTKQPHIAKTNKMTLKNNVSNARKLLRRTQHGKPVVASTKQPHISKTNKMTLKNNVSNARELLRRTQHGKPVVASIKQHNIAKTKEMINNASNSRKLQHKDRLYTKRHLTTITNEGVSVLKQSKERKRIDLSNPKSKLNEMPPSLGVLGITRPSIQHDTITRSRKANPKTQYRKKDTANVKKVENSANVQKQNNSINHSKLSKNNPLRSLLAEIKASKRPGVNKKGLKSLVAKLRTLSKMGGPMSKWVLAELKNRILHQQHLQAAALQSARQQSHGTLPVAAKRSNLIK